MKKEMLLTLLTSYYPVTPEFWQALSRALMLVSYPRHYHLVEVPKVVDHIYFILEGFAISYQYEDGRKHVESLWQGGQFIFRANAFFKGSASKEFIQLATPCEICCLRRDHVLELLQEFPESNVLLRLLLCYQEENARERMWDFRRMSAVERFEKLLKDFPSVEQYLPQESIASYLGIAPQSLTRIKRQLR